MSVMAGKWENYTLAHSEALGQLFNRSIRRTLRVGLQTLLTNTQMDSGRAAAHWVIRPNKGAVRPGAWGQANFPNPDYGQGAVGWAGDKAGTNPAVVNMVMERETRRSIDATVKGRRPATTFTFSSSVPQYFDEATGQIGTPKEGQDYHKHAKLRDAMTSAQSEMQRVFRQTLARGAIRKRPLR